MVLKSLLGRLTGEAEGTVTVQLLIKGRIGEGWHDVDRKFRLPEGTTLEQFFERAESQGIAIRELIAQSPHLSDTLMLNGERCPVAENLDVELFEGDEIYLLAPVAGG